MNEFTDTVGETQPRVFGSPWRRGDGRRDAMIGVRMSARMAMQLREEADRRKMSASSFIEAVLAEFIQSRQVEDQAA